MKSLLRMCSLAALPVLLLASCGKEMTIPEKGYNLYKKENNKVLVSKGYSVDSIKYEKCSYAWIKDDGTEEATVFKNTIWYGIRYTVYVGGVNELENYVGVFYSPEANTVREVEYEIFWNMAEKVKQGIYSGIYDSIK